MAREELKTLTEQMFYILLALKEPMYGLELAEFVSNITEGQVELAPGTLYALLGRFETDGYIEQVHSESNRKTYTISEKGQELLDNELIRLNKMIQHYEQRDVI